MHRTEIRPTRTEFDSFYIPMRELLWRQLKPMCKQIESVHCDVPQGRGFGKKNVELHIKAPKARRRRRKT